MYPGSGHIGGCLGIGYTKSRTAPTSSHGGSIASLIRCTTSEGESAPSASAVPSSDAPGAIMCRGSYGRTVRISTLTEALVFHQTLSTPKVSFSGGIRRAHPKGEPKRSTFFSKDPIMRTSYNTCPFHTSKVLKKYIITLPNVRVRNNKQQNLETNI